MRNGAQGVEECIYTDGNMKKSTKKAKRNVKESLAGKESKKIIAFRCPSALLDKVDATCHKYSMDRTAYISLALEHMSEFLETGEGSFNTLYSELLEAKKKRKPRRAASKKADA